MFIVYFIEHYDTVKERLDRFVNQIRTWFNTTSYLALKVAGLIVVTKQLLQGLFLVVHLAPLQRDVHNSVSNRSGS